MAFFERQDSYSVGNSTIDRHHKTLIDYVNKLADAVDRGGDVP
jgi:hemerythrin